MLSEVAGPRAVLPLDHRLDLLDEGLRARLSQCAAHSVPLDDSGQILSQLRESMQTPPTEKQSEGSLNLDNFALQGLIEGRQLVELVHRRCVQSSFRCSLRLASLLQRCAVARLAVCASL